MSSQAFDRFTRTLARTPQQRRKTLALLASGVVGVLVNRNHDVQAGCK